MADGTILSGAPPASDTARVGSLKAFARRRSTIAFIMCIPLLIVVISLVVYPAGYAIYLSMLNKKMTKFVGLSNYTFLLSRPTFQLVIFQSVFFAVTAVVAKAFIGFVLAHLMQNVPSNRQRIWRGLLLVPWVIPLAMSTLGWWWLFDPSYSALNFIIQGLGGPQIPWLGATWWARFSVILVNVWYGAPFFLIMYMAALKSVPDQLYEAASIDGASRWRTFVQVTLPLLRPAIAVAAIFRTITALQTFDIPFTMTRGGPGRSTTTLAMLIHQTTVDFLDLGTGSTLAVLLAVASLVLSLIYIRVLRT